MNARTIYNNIEFEEGVQFISIDGINYADVITSLTKFQLSIKAYTSATTKELAPVTPEHVDNP
ncbi:MAG: hypothetical protein E7161_03500 [Firmicutes bacterium]|nr:hypothetical protein [Bacillota bacterium]